MKTPLERGLIGAWAYESRADADLSVEEVAERLTRAGQPVTAATLRGIEGGSKKPSRRLLKAMAQVYGKPAPGEPEPAPATDPAAIVAAIDRQTAAVTRLCDLLAQTLSQATEARDAAAIGRQEIQRALGLIGRQVGLAETLGVASDAPPADVPRRSHQ